MRYGRYGLPYLVLRVALGITFLWIGVDILRNPETWLGYVPTETPFGIARETALQLGGFLDISLGVFFLLKVWPKMTGALAAFHLLGVLITQGIDAVLIRDVGLMGAALSIALWPAHYRRKRNWWWKNGMKKKLSGEDDA